MQKAKIIVDRAAWCTYPYSSILHDWRPSILHDKKRSHVYHFCDKWRTPVQQIFTTCLIIQKHSHKHQLVKCNNSCDWNVSGFFDRQNVKIWWLIAYVLKHAAIEFMQALKEQALRPRKTTTCNKQAINWLLLRWFILHNGPYYTDFSYVSIFIGSFSIFAHTCRQTDRQTDRHRLHKRD